MQLAKCSSKWLTIVVSWFTSCISSTVGLMFSSQHVLKTTRPLFLWLHPPPNKPLQRQVAGNSRVRFRPCQTVFPPKSSSCLKKNCDFFDVFVGKKKRKKSLDSRKWPTATVQCAMLQTLLHIRALAEARRAKWHLVRCGWRLCGHRCAGIKLFSATFIALKDCSLVAIYFFIAGSSVPLFWTGSRHQEENKDKGEQTGELGWNGWAGTSTVRYI